MLARAQESFRKDLPGFDAGRLLGTSLDAMTREPAVLRGVIEKLTDIATRQEIIGGRTMKTFMSPMKDDTGRRLGTVLEWFDRTQEVATEAELHEVIAAVTAGNLENRISLDGKRDFFLTLSRGINELVEAISTVVVEVRGVVAAANQGDLNRRIDTQGKAGLSPARSRPLFPRSRQRQPRSAAAPTKSARAMPICRSARKSRRRRSKKQLRRWKK
jgi:methyl-accepting chemotaxis protein